MLDRAIFLTSRWSLCSLYFNSWGVQSCGKIDVIFRLICWLFLVVWCFLPCSCWEISIAHGVFRRLIYFIFHTFIRIILLSFRLGWVRVVIWLIFIFLSFFSFFHFLALNWVLRFRCWVWIVMFDKNFLDFSISVVRLKVHYLPLKISSSFSWELHCVHEPISVKIHFYFGQLHLSSLSSTYHKILYIFLSWRGWLDHC